ncbi:hypothetical protein GCM10027176_59040 [Actinoallomurus bryophytorum]|uniref:Uncharacterized protein n=1 Tax=Actinoallomurus bryophytorum TaxID=1490222 RepID=A0A543CH42_9ACTN|nr:hypothetical protein [Actinoallomurus bryophytorum]TQL96401.1 hypothetical protein FB559_1928 [Actinoallomurus bryophytorum]
MLKKTAVTGGLLIAAAAGALVTTCSPAFAAPTHLVSDHTRNWNGSENESYNHIRLHLRNRNNNIAVARTPQRRRDFIQTPVITPPVLTPPVVG